MTGDITNQTANHLFPLSLTSPAAICQTCITSSLTHLSRFAGHGGEKKKSYCICPISQEDERVVRGAWPALPLFSTLLTTSKSNRHHQSESDSDSCSFIWEERHSHTHKQKCNRTSNGRDNDSHENRTITACHADYIIITSVCQSRARERNGNFEAGKKRATGERKR